MATTRFFLRVKGLDFKRANCLKIMRLNSTFTSKTLPRYTEIHSERIKDSTLHPWCDLVIPEITYWDFIFDNLSQHAHLPALVCGLSNRTLLHQQVKEEALKVSGSLRSLGLQKGDVIGILLPNCIEYPLIFLGALHSGLTVTPLNPLYTAPEISKQLEAAGAKALITSDMDPQKTSEVVSTNKKIESHIVLGKRSPEEASIGWEDFLSLTSKSGPSPQQVDVDVRKDVAVLPFSSGTTGVPKGVQISQHNLVANNVMVIGNDPEYMLRASGQTQDTTICALPMFHIFGLNVVMSGFLHMGGKNVVLPAFKPDLFVKLMEEHRPTTLSLVPPLVSFLSTSPLVKRSHLSNLRQILAGAAPSGPELIKQFYNKAPEYTVYKEGFGATEVAGAGTGIFRAAGGIKSGSVNQILPNSRLQIRDIVTDKPLGKDQRGEIVMKGPHCMLGYSNNEKANLETFDPEGWLRTGDIGYFDEEGFVFIVDRMKELIKVKAQQVAPAELEDVLRGLPGVVDVAVIGVEDLKAGQVPRAYIVREDQTLTEDMVQEFMAVQVAPHKQLAGGIEWVEAIPKSTAGKILRKDISKDYQEKVVNK